MYHGKHRIAWKQKNKKTQQQQQKIWNVCNEVEEKIKKEKLNKQWQIHKKGIAYNRKHIVCECPSILR